MATTNYPASIDNYAQPNNGDTISVTDHWLAPAIIAVENELGTDPAGSFTDVKSRLDDVDNKIVQVQSTTKTDTFSTNSSTFTDITGLSVSITPKSASSKILIVASLCGDLSLAAYGAHFRLVRDSTGIALGDAAGSRTRTTSGFDSYNTGSLGWKVCTMNFLDNPSTTSSVTYKVQARSANATASVLINRNGDDSDQAGIARGVSTITVMEIGE